VSVNGKRERDLRNGFAIPFRPSARSVLDAARRLAWLLRQVRHGLPQLANFGDAGRKGDVNAQAALMKRQMDASFAWNDLDALRQSWPHVLVVKGICRVEDAKRCEALGVDAVVLSNHGGRQLDDTPAPLALLRGTAGQLSRPVLTDSGIRRGADVVKSVALGASAVMLGRATLYGLAARGGAGVAHVLDILRAEIDTTLALLGRSPVAALQPDDVVEETVP